jgi:hypothetical protein
VPIRLERVHVTLEQIHAIAVQRFDVPLQYQGGQLVVDGRMLIVGLLHELRDQLADLLVLR